MLKLKAIKHSAFASQETHCFTGTLYFGKVKLGTVGNDGHGGCDYQHWSATPAQVEAAEKYVAGLPREPSELFPEGYPQSIESQCCDLVNTFLATRDLKRRLKNRVLWTQKDKNGLFQTRCAKTPLALKSWIQQISDRETTDIMLNRLPLDAALAIFTERT